MVVQTVARATEIYLPFCGTLPEKDTMVPYMMGYYFGATDGGVFCKEQSLPLIISRLQWVLSICEPEAEYPFIPPCTVCCKERFDRKGEESFPKTKCVSFLLLLGAPCILQGTPDWYFRIVD